MRNKMVLILVFLVLLGGCSPKGGLPDDVQDEMLNRYSNASRRNVRLEVTGVGQVLPQEENRGWERVVCVKTYYEHKTDDNWQQHAISGIAWKIGDYWEYEQRVGEYTWSTHSCPGTHEDY